MTGQGSSVRVQSCLTKSRASFRKKKIRRKSDFCGMIKYCRFNRPDEICKPITIKGCRAIREANWFYYTFRFIKMTYH